MVKVAIFDAYGTLLDVNAAMRRHAGRLGKDWQRISQEWRSKHIEYTWVRTLAGPAQHRDFWQLAKESLFVVAERNGITDRALLDDVLQSYLRLEPYPEVPDTLRRLRAKAIGCAVLSNGEPKMLAETVKAGGIADLLDAVLSAESAGTFKPDPRVYQLATGHFGLQASEMAFFSSNPWDAFGAARFGFKVYWVNRSGLSDEYGLGESATELRHLRDLPTEGR